MSVTLKPKKKESLYFITLKLSRELTSGYATFILFDRREICDEILKTLINSIEKDELNIYGFVILSNQIYLIADVSEGQLSDAIDRLKKSSARAITLLLSKKLGSFDRVKNRDQQDFRRFIGQLLNLPDISFWQNNESYVELNFKDHKTNLKPLSGQLLAEYLSDNNRNYLQLGASSFTKLMMKSMKI